MTPLAHDAFRTPSSANKKHKMNLDDLLDYTGYDSPDWSEEKDQEEDIDGDDSEEEVGEEDDEEGAGDDVDEARRTDKRKPKGKKLGDIEADWVRGERGKQKVGEHLRPC
jgi:hypothetical protein